jgi:hypothetical protein
MQSGVQALAKDSNKVFKEDFLFKPPYIILDDSTWRNRELRLLLLYSLSGHLTYLNPMLFVKNRFKVLILWSRNIH